jgi:hypothetical protein
MLTPNASNADADRLPEPIKHIPLIEYFIIDLGAPTLFPENRRSMMLMTTNEQLDGR